MLQLAESPYNMLEISREFRSGAWRSQAFASYGEISEDNPHPASGTYNILSVRMKMGGM